jgi:PPOX class probable F420-dependent enzyme
MATLAGDAAVRLVPCCFALDPATDTARWYWVVDAKPKTTLAVRRLADLAARPSVTLLVDHWDEDWSQLWWARLDGRGRVLEPGSDDDRRARELLAAKYAQYRRDPPPGAAVAVEITGWRWWSASGRW